MSKSHSKAFEIFDGESEGAARGSGGNWPDLKNVTDTHCNLW